LLDYFLAKKVLLDIKKEARFPSKIRLLSINRQSIIQVILKPNWFWDFDASAFANAEASLGIKIRKPFRVEYILLKLSVSLPDAPCYLISK
jgi:hypothetical protein